MHLSTGLILAHLGPTAWQCVAAVAVTLLVAAVVCNRLSKNRMARQLAQQLQDKASLRTVLEQMPSIVWTTDADLRFTSCEGAGLVGLDDLPPQMVGVHFHDYFHTSDPAFLPIAKHLQALDGVSSNYEFKWNNRTFLVHCDPLRDASGKIVGTVGVGTDISARKAAEEALALSEAKNRALLMAIPDVMFRMTRDGTVLEFIDKLTAPTQDYAGRSVRDVFLPADLADRFLHAARGALDTQAAQSFEYATTADRQQRFFEARVVGCCGDEVLVIVRNITLRRQAENDLRQREAELRSLLKAIPDQIFQIDRDGRIVGCITTPDGYLVLPADQLLGKVAADLAPPDIGARFRKILAQTFETGRPHAMQYSLELQGQTHHFEARLTINTADPAQVLSCVRDVTHLKAQSPDPLLAAR